MKENLEQVCGLEKPHWIQLLPTIGIFGALYADIRKKPSIWSYCGQGACGKTFLWGIYQASSLAFTDQLISYLKQTLQ